MPSILASKSEIRTKMRHLFQIPLTTHPCSDVSSHCAQRTVTNSCTIEELTRDSRKKLAEFRQRGDGDEDGERERVAELFNAFLDYLPTDGAVVLMQDILDLNDDDGSVFRLHDHLVDGIIIQLRAAGGRTPAPAPTPSPCSSDEDEEDGDEEEEDEEENNDNSTPPPRPQSEKKALKEACLRRDGYRCKVSNLWDEDSIDSCKDLRDTQEKTGGMFDTTEAVHILPFALAADFDDMDDDVQMGNRAAIWGCLYRYFPGLDGLIAPESINGPINAFTLVTVLHHRFSAFNFTLEETETPHTYKPINYNKGVASLSTYLPRSGQTTFQSHDTSVAMPSPYLLSLHARVGKIIDGVRGLGRALYVMMRRYDDLALEDIDPSGETDVGAVVAGKCLMLTW